MYTDYLMESDSEAERLELKDNTQNTRIQLLTTGIGQFIQNGCCIVDAGTGVGVVSLQIAEMIKDAGADANQILLDASEERLMVAKSHLMKYKHKKSFYKCDLENIPLPDGSVDYLFCRFVFEYLQNPESVFSEFLRIMKPGGKLVIGDLDNNSMTHYPLAKELEEQLHLIMDELNRKFSFDPYAGRKLFSYYKSKSLEQIKIHMFAHHLFYGELNTKDQFNWESKIKRLIELQNQGKIDLKFNVKDFGEKFIKFLKSEDRFSYTPLILVEGIVP